MLNSHDILETINMIDNENLDVRTITMGISLLDCIDPDANRAYDKIYDKICRYAQNLVKTGEDISKEYGIPIIHKRISVTPIAMLAAACPGSSPVHFAKALDTSFLIPEHRNELLTFHHFIDIAGKFSLCFALPAE